MLLLCVCLPPAMSPMTLGYYKYKREGTRTDIHFCLETYVLAVFVKREGKIIFTWSLEKLNAALVVLSLINRSLTELAPHLFNLLENPLQ
jgi:hypothetical protein